MTPSEKLRLCELLLKMAEEGEGQSEMEPTGRPAGFVPEVCLKAFYKATRTPFIELIIYRKRAGKFEYLYYNRNDQRWVGYSAFGGMVRPDFPAHPVEVAQKLIAREFKGLGLKVITLQEISSLTWQVHPWCNPFAVVCLIQIEGQIPEGGNYHWLSVDSLPEPMVPIHANYLRQCEYFLNSGKPLTFTPEQPYGVPGLT